MQGIADYIKKLFFFYLLSHDVLMEVGEKIKISLQSLLQFWEKNWDINL